MALGKLSPIDVYYYSHNWMAWFEKLYGKYWQFPEICKKRLDMAWKTTFILDDSGRSTTKTTTYFLVGMAKNRLFEDRVMNLFCMDRDKGIQLADEHIGRILRTSPNFADGIKRQYPRKPPKVTHRQSGAVIWWENSSMFQTYTPGLQTGGKKALSDRSNYLFFNEYSSWPAGTVNIMEKNIKPINTRTNYRYGATNRLRIATEKSLGIPLGRLTQEYLIEDNRNKANYIPRRWLSETKPDKSFEKIREKFLRNFKYTFGFNYLDGIKDNQLKFLEIDSEDVIVKFFEKYLIGDPVYQNQIVYDGSAQEPTDEIYQEFVKDFFSRVKKDGKLIQNMLDLTINKNYIEEMLEDNDSYDPHCNWFNCHIDDIPEEWDGIIYDSAVVNDARRSWLKDDFDRVYGGRWISGQSYRPIDKEDLDKCRIDNVNILLNRKNDSDVYVIGVDAAHGTEASHKGKAGKHDDAAGAVVKVGEGTRENPHEIVHIYKADDVKKEPMAFDLHKLHLNFSFQWMALDPGGGGKELSEVLAHKNIEVDGEYRQVQPIVHIEYIYYDGTQDAILLYISRGEEIIKTVYTDAYKQPPFRGEEMLRHAIITNTQRLIERGGVAFPPRLSEMQMIARRNQDELSLQEMDIYLNLEEAIKQMLKINYLRDKKSGLRLKTNSGVFKYNMPKRKDLAMVVFYALFMADVYVKWKELISSKFEDKYIMAVG